VDVAFILNMVIKTKLTELLGIKHPIVQGKDVWKKKT
jgi:hypothetical protein